MIATLSKDRRAILDDHHATVFALPGKSPTPLRGKLALFMKWLPVNSLYMHIRVYSRRPSCRLPDGRRRFGKFLSESQ
jgi:hypothetical protein